MIAPFIRLLNLLLVILVKILQDLNGTSMVQGARSTSKYLKMTGAIRELKFIQNCRLLIRMAGMIKFCPVRGSIFLEIFG